MIIMTRKIPAKDELACGCSMAGSCRVAAPLWRWRRMGRIKAHLMHSFARTQRAAASDPKKRLPPPV